MIRNSSILVATIFRVTICISLVFASVAGLAQPTAPQAANTIAASLPLTTKSPEARRLVKEALDLYLDKVEQEQAIELLSQRMPPRAKPLGTK